MLLSTRGGACWSIWREAISNRITVIETRSVTWTAALGMFTTF